MLESNRFFDPDRTVRDIARELHDGVKDLPLVCPHGHVDPALLSKNQPFRDPTELIIIPDHYIFRMLYSQGISLESLGLSSQEGEGVEHDRRKIWQVFADNFYLFAGTPSGAWLGHEFSEVFGINERLNGESAQRIYDGIQEQLRQPQFRPRALFDRFNIEVLTTTDAAESSLAEHQAIRESDWQGRVIPCFRPDGVTDIGQPAWRENIKALGETCNLEITSYKRYLEALEQRREFFKEMGAVSTDHAVVAPFTQQLPAQEAESLFQKALAGKVSAQDADAFSAHMLMEMAKMSSEDSLVMQLHAGSFRNHNRKVFDRFGPDMGCDIPVQTEYTRNLYELLNKYGNEPNFNIIVFTLDESTYSRELAPLAGHYPALKLGPPWWFHDSIQGMIRFRQMVLETAGIYNTVGFNDDTRAFASIPARHDLARRVDCNFLAGLVARHIIDLSTAHTLARALAYELVKKAYHL